MSKNRNLTLLIFLPLTLLMQGCVGAVVGGAAGATVVAQDNRTLGTLIEDQGIESKAMMQLRFYQDVYEPTHINVTSFNRNLLVTGEAPTAELRERVLKIFSSVPNVNKTYNEIRIAEPSSALNRSKDSYLTSKVKTLLLADKRVMSSKIKVVSENRVVYLMGLVSHAQADIVIDLVRRTIGVQKVVSLLEYTD